MSTENAASAPLGRRRLAALASAAGLGALVLLALGVGLTRDPSRIVSPLVGRAAPDFRIQALDGRWVRLADYLGHPVVLNFWASWCPPCRDEAPLLADAAATYGPNGLVVLGVVFQDSPDAARAFMAGFGQRYPGLIDPGGRTALDYGVGGIPETFFIGRDGTIVAKQIGPVTDSSLRADIDAILP